LGLAGYAMGKTFDQVDAIVGPIATGIIVMIVAAYIWRLLRWTPNPK
jgi:membrane protein DedA with SNARE-associated domain